jgi:hypothetical protein
MFTAASEDHSAADCLLVVAMTHGEAGYLHTRDTEYRTQELWLRFTGKRCPTLVGKPKLFFIQVNRIYLYTSVTSRGNSPLLYRIQLNH